jgi:hypothetical protein
VNHVTSPVYGNSIDEDREPVEPETFRNNIGNCIRDNGSSGMSRIKPLDLSKLSTLSVPKQPDHLLTLRNQNLFEYCNPRDSNLFSQHESVIDSGEAMFRKFQ